MLSSPAIFGFRAPENLPGPRELKEANLSLESVAPTEMISKAVFEGYLVVLHAGPLLPLDHVKCIPAALQAKEA